MPAMGFWNIRYLLNSFIPSLGFFAINYWGPCEGHGKILRCKTKEDNSWNLDLGFIALFLFSQWLIMAELAVSVASEYWQCTWKLSVG